MIGVRLMGGLGNQMFQYAVARRLAHDRHTGVFLDMIFFENIADVDTPRHYELDCFALKANVLPANQRPIEDENRYKSGLRGRYRLGKDLLRGRRWHIYREPHHNFDEAVLSLPNSSYLIGFWQTENYFKAIRPLILEDFRFTAPLSPKQKQLLGRIRHSDSVSLHVRRSDYVTNPHAAKFHGLKDEAYYKAALKPVTTQVKNPTLFVFSDDLAWCKQNLKLGLETVFVEGGKTGSDDMRLMSHCKHNIIANSSFSWWGAWLNQNDQKIVVAPRQWFNDSSVNTKDVIPKSWHQI